MHEKGHILDNLIIHKLESHLYLNVQVIPGISDHSGVTCKLQPYRTVNMVNARIIKAIDRAAFAKKFKSAPSTSSSDIFEGLVDNYNVQLRSTFDSLAHAKSRRIKQLPENPWYNYEITIAKQKRRQLERRWRPRGQLEIDFSVINERLSTSLWLLTLLV